MIKKITITLFTLAILASIGFYTYQSRLNQSKEEGSKIPSRAVSSTTPEVSSGPMNSNSTTTEVSTSKVGQFVTLDPLHYARGSVSTKQVNNNVIISFSNDFETNPDGPDLYVWLVKKQDIKNIAAGGVSTNTNDYLDLGKIQNKKGSQLYQVTLDEFKQNDYAVVIWCRAFNIQFSNALLK